MIFSADSVGITIDTGVHRTLANRDALRIDVNIKRGLRVFFEVDIRDVCRKIGSSCRARVIKIPAAKKNGQSWEKSIGDLVPKLTRSGCILLIILFSLLKSCIKI